MPTRRNTMTVIAALALAALAGLVTPARAQRDGLAVSFVKITTTKLVTIVNSGSTAQEMHQQLETIVDSSVDVDGIGIFCLGRFWNSATPDQQRDYLIAFRRHLVAKIAKHLGDYQGVRLTVGVAQPGAGTEIVASTVERSGAPSTQIDWVVGTTADGKSRIVDLLSAGTSLRQTQTSDFRSYLAQHNNSVQNLIDGLRQLVAVSR
jgi:phospholipid transport system substrate-binding protein